MIHRYAPGQSDGENFLFKILSSQMTLCCDWLSSIYLIDGESPSVNGLWDSSVASVIAHRPDLFELKTWQPSSILLYYLFDFLMSSTSVRLPNLCTLCFQYSPHSSPGCSKCSSVKELAVSTFLTLSLFNFSVITASLLSLLLISLCYGFSLHHQKQPRK